MANQTCLLISIFLFPILVAAVSNCRGPCHSGSDCSGQLTCINGKCNDDPNVGTHICSSGGHPYPKPPSGGDGHAGGGFPATLTNNDFSKGGDGGGPSECDGHYHSNKERIVALSTRWYAGGSRCGKMIHITTKSGKYTTAKVVDECDTPRDGCGNSIVDASSQVWHDLGLNIDVGEVPVTWSMA